uniref:Uncharacterized protein n=1 Tax=Arundo donax TaxID=35708 RepID=A0A0A9A268_ARUDO
MCMISAVHNITCTYRTPRHAYAIE